MERPPVYVHRDLSQLHFNERILQEADDKTVPLIERLVFLGIFSNNLDEFYRKRIAGHESAAHDVARRASRHTSRRGREKREEADRVFADIELEMTRSYAEFNRIYGEVWASLGEKKIFLVDEKKLSPEQGRFVRRFFHEKVRRNITPIMLEHFHRTDYLHDQAAYLIAELRSSGDPLKLDYALIEIPTGELSRFLILPQNTKGETFILFLDDVIRYCLHDVFAIFGFDTFSAYSIKFNRNEDVEIDNDKKDYLVDVLRGVARRRYGKIVRLVYDGRMPLELLARVAKVFGIPGKELLKEGGKYHNLKDFASFPRDILPKEMVYRPLPVVRCAALPRERSILDTVRQNDVILHYPYQSFQNIIDMLLQASVDRRVRSIKMTIYRAARNSRVINALINAARNEKEVTAYVELQASFDEEANVGWAEIMKAEGIRTVYYAPGGLKVHSKLLIIRREEKGRMVDYTAIGTGNPNEATSRIYGDHHLLTADKRLTSDVNKVFELLESKKLKKPKFEALVVSPFATRKTFLALFDREIHHAMLGREAWAIVKLNNLVDRAIVDKMYEASRAGVRIQCVIRGMCVLVPGLEELSENITAVRIVDRYLEHARVLVFANDGKPEYFMGSADWMSRNFDNRVEVTTPVFDPDIREELMRILQIQLADNVKASPVNGSRTSVVSKKKLRSQYAIHEMLREANEE